eukprot:6443925-Lingulodinium_polyedra.AAC.1
MAGSTSGSTHTTARKMPTSWALRSTCSPMSCFRRGPEQISKTRCTGTDIGEGQCTMAAGRGCGGRAALMPKRELGSSAGFPLEPTHGKKGTRPPP